MTRDSAWIALLRGINITTRNRIAMAELRAAATGLGWRDVRSWIQSGNLVFRADQPAAALERGLETEIERRFHLAIPVLVRSARQWTEYTRGNPFPEESAGAGKLVMLVLGKSPPPPDAVERLEARAAAGEAVRRAGDALWIHYAAGFARSKLTPGLLDRVCGSPVTTRNWRTVLKLHELVAAA